MYSLEYFLRRRYNTGLYINPSPRNRHKNFKSFVKILYYYSREFNCPEIPEGFKKHKRVKGKRNFQANTVITLLKRIQT